MDFKVLKVSNLSLDDNQTIHYTNAKNEKKKFSPKRKCIALVVEGTTEPS